MQFSNYIHAIRGTSLVMYLEVEWLLWGAVCCCMHLFLCLHDGLAADSWLFSCAGILWSDPHCRIWLARSDLHPQAADVEFSQDKNLFSPLLPNGRPDRFETCWACSYHHYAPPIAKLRSMDAHISRKTKNGWRLQRSIFQKPCIGIGRNCLGRES